jgi:hypothetical protein
VATDRGAAGRFPRRATDLVEDAVLWLLSSLVLLLVVLAVMTAVAAYGHITDRSQGEAARHAPVRAVLAAAAPAMVDDSGYRLPVGVPATWTGPDGRPHAGSIPVLGPLPAGADVSVWVDEQGSVVDAPPTAIEAAAAAFLTAVFIVACGGGVLAGGWGLARRAIGAANSRRWEREWADVGPRWSGRL